MHLGTFYVDDNETLTQINMKGRMKETTKIVKRKWVAVATF